MSLKTFVFVAFFLFLPLITVQAETVHLSIAASMTDATKELIAVFSNKHKDASIQPNFAGSGSLAKQIAQGAPADIFVSANPKWMNYLVEKQMIAPGTDRIFVFNKLVFISEKPLGVQTLEGLGALDRIAIGSPKSVPAGLYAKQALENAGIYKTLAGEKKFILAKDVRQALLYADRGEVDGALVYKTDALLARNARIIFTVQEDLYNRVSYPIGLTVAGAENNTAKAFYDYIGSPEAIAVLTQYGFEPNPK